MSASDRLGSDTMRKMKDRLRSWRLSADTATNARGTKVICGRIYDAHRPNFRARIFRNTYVANKHICGRQYLLTSCEEFLRARIIDGIETVALLPENGPHRLPNSFDRQPMSARW